MRRVLVVEDDPDIVELLAHYFGREGWSIDAESHGRRALERLRAGDYQLVILDLQLPGQDGLTICKEARRDAHTRDLPIIMLTARGDETDRIVGLELGADDYVVKPFSPRELMARVRALLRRAERSGAEELALPLARGELDVDRARRTVRWAGAAVHLTAKEFDLLVALLAAHGRVLTREHLLEDVWGGDYAEGTRTLDVHVRRLREKLPGLAGALVTVKGLGYRLTQEDER